MPITRRFTVYTNAGVSVPPVIHVNQYDRGETWIFTLLEPNGSQYIPASGGIVGIKADGHAIINTATVNGNGEVVVSETQQMTAAAGKAVYEIIFDNSTHGTANFIVCVEPKPGDNATLSDSDLSLIQEAVDQAERIAQYGSPLVATSSSQMTNHNSVYVYTGTTTSSLTNGHWYYWNGSAWADGGVYNSVAVTTDTTLTQANVAADAKKVGDVTSELKTDLTDITGTTRIELTPYRMVSLSGSSVIMSNGVPVMSSSANYSCGMMQCSAGDVFTIYGVGGSSPRLYGFVNSSGTILEPLAGEGAEGDGFLVTAPTNAAWIIVHTNDGRYSFKGRVLKNVVEQNEEDIAELEEIRTVYKNVFNPEAALMKKTAGSSGSILDDANVATNNNYCLSACISTKPGKKYTVNSLGYGTNVYWGNSAGNYSGSSTVGNTFVVPSGKYYFRFRISINGGTAIDPEDFMIIEGESFPDHYVKYGKEIILNEDINIPQLDDYETLIDAATHATKMELTGLSAKVDTLDSQLSNLRTDGSEITINIPNTTGGTVKNATIRLALHKGTTDTVQDWNEIFSNEFNEFGVQSLRFVDALSGDILPHDLMCHGNYEFFKDRRFPGSWVLHLSDKTLITTSGYDIKYSTDSGVTWITFTEFRGQAVFVDSNDNIYFENTYSLYRALAPEYTTKELIIDLSETESHVRANAIKEDSDGNIFFGVYQAAFNVKAYKLASGETTPTLCFSPNEGQHVHTISINRRTTPNEIYIGVDPGNYSTSTWCWRSTDSGATFTRLNIPDRATDYGYVYFGDGFALGCGETNLKGGSTIYRSTDVTDPTKYSSIVKTLQGIRRIHNPKDNILLAYGCAGITNKIEQYLMSKDNGLTWECVYANDLMPISREDSGDGIRYVTDYFVPKGDTEYQVIGTGYAMSYAVRVFIGGDRYSAICYVNVGDIPTGGKTIKLKTGYMIDKSDEANTRGDIEEPLFVIEPIGDNKIKTTNGVVDVTGGYTSENANGTVRYGGIQGSMVRNTIGAKFAATDQIDIGDIGLTKNTGLTVMMYINTPMFDTIGEGYILVSNDRKTKIGIAGTSIKLVTNNKLYYCSVKKVPFYASDYAMIAFTIEKSGSNVIVKTYSPDCDATVSYIRTVALEDWGTEDISATSWTIGDGSSTPTYGLSNIMIFDKCLTGDEICAVYHGRNYYAGKNVYDAN